MRNFKRSKIESVFYLIFVLIGAKFLLDYLLPTNPASKNPVISFLWGKSNHMWNWNIKDRIFFCYVYMGIHAIALLIMTSDGYFFSLSNILVNIYPIIIQIYILYKCKHILNLRYKNFILHTVKSIQYERFRNS